MKRRVRSGGSIIEYTLYKTSRSAVILRAPAPGKLRVYAPSWAKLRDIDDIVREKADSVREMWRDYERAPLEDGARITIEGRPRVMRLSKGELSVAMTDGEIAVSAPSPEAAREALIAYLSKLALERVRLRIRENAPDEKIGRVTIRAQRTRWGSCSSRGNLSFNWKLILAPREALDYVVIHELAHLKEFSHSPRFWRLVAERMPDYEYWKKWLKTNGAKLDI